jgi:uncharacterized protein (TIGR00290 family)
MKERIALSWSGGKDCALALHELRRGGYEVAALLTTVTEGSDRIGMHAVRRELLLRQVASLGLPLREIAIPPFPPNETYEERMRQVLDGCLADGIRAVAFGDLFLEDIRNYRERNLARVGMRGIYPLWGRDTAALGRELVDLGFRAVVVCVDSRKLDRSFVGREIDARFLAELPPAVDPCGENGEFHTFVFDGPDFRAPVPFVRGAARDEPPFVYLDLLAA